MCFIMYKLYPRLHTYNFKTTSGGRSLHFKVRTFALEFRRIKVKMQEGSLANEVHKEACTQFPGLFKEKDMKIKFDQCENCPDERSKSTRKCEYNKKLAENIHVGKSTEQDTTTTTSVTSGSRPIQLSNTPCTRPPEFADENKSTTDFEISNSTIHHSTCDDLHFAIVEEDANTMWKTKKFQEVIPLLELLLQSQRGGTGGTTMLKLALCRLKQAGVSTTVGSDLFIKGCKEIEKYCTLDHVTASKLCDIAVTYAQEDFPRRSYILFVCATRLLQGLSWQKRLSIYREVVFKITPLEKIPSVKDKVMDIISSIMKDCEGFLQVVETFTVRGLCATSLANLGNYKQSCIAYDDLLNCLRPKAHDIDVYISLLCQCLYGQTINNLNLGNMTMASEYFREARGIIDQVRHSTSPYKDSLIAQYDNSMEQLGSKFGKFYV
uniref:Uncharacterized protein n=1 Tax=Ciona savignyi TaxID=51511 RepID=H2ZAA9_CIOSA